MIKQDNTLRVWRLATSTRPAQAVAAEPALRAGRWHDVGDRVLYAYESEELAALSLSQMTQGAEPASLVHESFVLPADRSLHGEFDVAGSKHGRRNFYKPGVVRLPVANLSFLMRERKLLSLWVTSPYSTLHRTVLLNAAHPAFRDIEIQSHILRGDTFFSTGPCSNDMSDSWARTAMGADAGPSTILQMEDELPSMPAMPMMVNLMADGTPCF